MTKGVNDCRFARTNFNSTTMKVYLQSMNVKGKYCLSFDDFECQYIILELSLRANEGHIGVNKSILSIKQIWTQMNGYFL